MDNISNLIAEFEQRYPGWRWLIRNDQENGYYVNLMTLDFEMINTRHLVTKEPTIGFTGQKFEAYGVTPVEAFKTAFKRIAL